MPRDNWKRANERAKYGPIRRTGAKRKPLKGKKRIPPNFRYPAEYVFLINIGTPITAIRPDGTEVNMTTTKTLRFGKQTQKYAKKGHHAFHRRGFHLIVANQYVRKDTMTRV